MTTTKHQFTEYVEPTDMGVEIGTHFTATCDRQRAERLQEEMREAMEREEQSIGSADVLGRRKAA